MAEVTADLLCLVKDVNDFCRKIAVQEISAPAPAIIAIRTIIRDSIHTASHSVSNFVEPSVASSPAGHRLQAEWLLARPKEPPLSTPSSSSSSSSSSTASTPLSTPDQLIVVPQLSLPDNSAVTLEESCTRESTSTDTQRSPSVSGLTAAPTTSVSGAGQSPSTAIVQERTTNDDNPPGLDDTLARHGEICHNAAETGGATTSIAAAPLEHDLAALITTADGSTVLVENSGQCDTDSPANSSDRSPQSVTENDPQIESSTAGSAEAEFEIGTGPDPGASAGSPGMLQDGSCPNSSRARPARGAAKGAKKRIHDASSSSPSRKKSKGQAKITQRPPTPRQLAGAFGNENAKIQILTIKQQWERVSRSRLLHKMSMHEMPGDLVPGDRTTYLAALKWQGGRLNKSTVEGQLHRLQDRINHANYHGLYKAALKDAAKGDDSLFIRWTDEWMRQRSISFKKRSGRGLGSDSEVVDRLVVLHFSDVELTPGADVAKVGQQHRTSIDTWQRGGETWFELTRCFGPGILMLVPPGEKESRFKFTKLQLGALLEALSLRKTEFEEVLADANEFMTTHVLDSRQGHWVSDANMETRRSSFFEPRLGGSLPEAREHSSPLEAEMDTSLPPDMISEHGSPHSTQPNEVDECRTPFGDPLSEPYNAFDPLNNSYLPKFYPTPSILDDDGHDPDWDFSDFGKLL